LADGYDIAVLDINTGMRRGELLALRLSDFDLDAATVSITRSLEETREGLRFKPPKTKRGVRTISIPPNTVVVLRDCPSEAAGATDGVGPRRSATSMVHPGGRTS
jgi:integrase